jgi:hypothetical protein
MSTSTNLNPEMLVPLLLCVQLRLMDQSPKEIRAEDPFEGIVCLSLSYSILVSAFSSFALSLGPKLSLSSASSRSFRSRNKFSCSEESANSILSLVEKAETVIKEDIPGLETSRTYRSLFFGRIL